MEDKRTMKTQITIMLAIVLALPLILAMYGGENQTIPFDFETDNCTIVPNVTEGINFTFNSNNVLVEPAINFVGEFNITCYDWLTKEEQTETSGGFPSGSAIRSSPLVNNNVNTINEDNETVIEEIVDNSNDYVNGLINYEPVIEKKSIRGRIIGAGSILILLIIVIWFSLREPKGGENNDDEEPLQETNL